MSIRPKSPLTDSAELWILDFRKSRGFVMASLVNESVADRRCMPSQWVGSAFRLLRHCTQPGTIPMGYPPLLLLGELSRWLPIPAVDNLDLLQMWTARVVTLCRANTTGLKQPNQGFLAEQRGELGRWPYSGVQP